MLRGLTPSKGPPLPVFLVSALAGPHVFESANTFGVFEKTGTTEKQVVVENDKVVYLGKLSSNQAEKNLLFRIDRANDGAILVNPDPNAQHVIVLTQEVPFLPPVKDEEPTATTAFARNLELVSTFGSRQRQRAMEKMTKGRVVDDNVAGRHAASAELYDKYEHFEVAKAIVENLLPPFDETADKVSECYPLERLIEQEERNEISEKWMTEQLGKLDVSTPKPMWGHFVTPIMNHSLKQSLTAKKTKKLSATSELQLAFFLGLLLRMKTVSPRQFSEKDLADKLGGKRQLAACFCARFAQKQQDGYMLTDKSRNKIDLAFLVGALTLVNFNLTLRPLEAIAKDLKMDVDKLSPFLLQIGCKAKGTGEKREWSLIAPLDFESAAPKVKRVRRGAS
jgi:hypothetical protein